MYDLDGWLRLVDPAKPERLREGDGLALARKARAGLDATLLGAGARHAETTLGQKLPDSPVAQVNRR